MGLRFVRSQPLLPLLAATVGGWQLCHNAALVVQILFATRELGMSSSAVGLSYVGLGVGTVLASVFGHRISERLGPGPCLVAGIWHLGPGLGRAGVGADRALGGGRFRVHAQLVRRGCGADLHQLPEPAPGGDAAALAWPHDQHHALVDLAAGRAGGAAGRLGWASTSACAAHSVLPAAPACCWPGWPGAAPASAGFARCPPSTTKPPQRRLERFQLPEGKALAGALVPGPG